MSMSRRVSRLNEIAQPYMEVWIDSWRHGEFDGMGSDAVARYDGRDILDHIGFLEEVLSTWEAFVPPERPVHAMR